jgi:hypothetical protein
MARYGNLEWRKEVACSHQVATNFAKEAPVIAPLATDFGPMVPQIARAEPVNCQPKGVKTYQTLSRKLTAK